MSDTTAFQDRIGENYCFGCGPDNPEGLQIKSYWAGENESICRYQPAGRHAAGPRHILNGGVIATLIDCHCICTAIAYAYRMENRESGTPPGIWCVTGSLHVDYLRPASIASPVELRATVLEVSQRKTQLSCELISQEEVCAAAKVLAIRVPPEWSSDAS
jgi:acyl-coenzyme A thioesterase PaaI-like protein